MGKRSSSSFVWGAGGNAEDVPLGAAKWITFPSSLNIFTSSIAWMGCTLSFLSDVCSFLSSVPDVLCTFFCFLRGVPLPLDTACRISICSQEGLTVPKPAHKAWPSTAEGQLE